MLFDYKCKSCGQAMEKQFPIGKADKEVDCECGGKAKRAYLRMSFQLKGGGWPGKEATFNQEMTRRNEEAGRRMKDNVPPVRKVAHDYGNGDIREV